MRDRDALGLGVPDEIDRLASLEMGVRELGGGVVIDLCCLHQLIEVLASSKTVNMIKLIGGWKRLRGRVLASGSGDQRTFTQRALLLHLAPP